MLPTTAKYSSKWVSVAAAGRGGCCRGVCEAQCNDMAGAAGSGYSRRGRTTSGSADAAAADDGEDAGALAAAAAVEELEPEVAAVAADSGPSARTGRFFTTSVHKRGFGASAVHEHEACEVMGSARILSFVAVLLTLREQYRAC